MKENCWPAGLECGGSTPLWMWDVRTIHSGVEPPHSKEMPAQAFSFRHLTLTACIDRGRWGTMGAREDGMYRLPRPCAFPPACVEQTSERWRPHTSPWAVTLVIGSTTSLRHWGHCRSAASP